MNRRSRERAYSLAVLAFVVGFALFKLAAPHPAAVAAPPAMTDSEAYQQICGHPDVCAKVHTFMQQIEAQANEVAAHPPATSTEGMKADIASVTGQPFPEIPKPSPSAKVIQ